MSEDLILYALIGFVAQLVDSSLGMSFGALSSSLLLMAGLPPQSLSATVHAAEIFGGSAAAASHWKLGNIDVSTIKKLALPALVGAILGALLVTRFDNETLRPLIGLYFAGIGIVIIVKTLFPSFISLIRTRREVLGFFGGFLDAFGGAGWGEFVSSGLLLRGFDIRKIIGSLIAVELMLAVTVTIIFFSTTGLTLWPVIISLSLGAVLAAPLGAWVCKTVPAKPLTLCVGTLVTLIGLKTVVEGFSG